MLTLRERDPRWDDQFLDDMRQIGDPLADNLISQLVDQDQLRDVNHVMRKIVKNSDQAPKKLPKSIKDYFNDTAELPVFIDREKIKIAQEIYRLYNLEIGLLLMYASLPASYAARKGAQVLMLTERMAKQKEAYNRLAETGQFVWDVMSPGGFGPNGQAIRSAQKVRLVHAVIRHHIYAANAKETIWDDDWGVAINQEDEVGTLLSFSLHVIEGLEKIGIRLTPDEKEAYFHLWRVVGIILGIRPELIPEDFASAEGLGYAIIERHFEESEEGKALTRIILNILEDSVRNEQFKKMPHMTMRYLLGDEIADMLGVEKSDWTAGLVKARFALLELGDSMRYSQTFPIRFFGQAGREVIGRVNFGFMNSMMTVQQAGMGSQFELPSVLKLTRPFSPMQTAILQAREASSSSGR